jgi:ligand-binding sensor domain-containing protein
MAVPRFARVLLLFWAFVPALAFAQELPATHYTTEKEMNPLPKPAITGLYQDRQGYLWLCAYGTGLVRYDGHKMEIFGEADSVVSGKTWFMCEDSTGRLWVGTERGLAVSGKPLAEYVNGERITFPSLDFQEFLPADLPIVRMGDFGAKDA